MRGEQDEAFEMAIDLNGGTRPDYVSGDYMCICPGHADASPSLAVQWSGKRLVYHCYAGCEFGAIARGIRSRGLDPITGARIGEEVTRTPRAPRPDPDAAFLASHVYEPTAPEWLSDRRAFESIADGPDVHRYVYRDTEGVPRMTVTRSMKPHRYKPGLHKVFVAVTPWRNTVTGRLDMPCRAAPEPRMPFGAETIPRPGPLVLAAEGEKCRDVIERLCGSLMPAISTYGSTPYLTDFRPISGRTLILFRDSDEPGRRYAAAVGAEHAGPTHVVEAPPGPDGRPDGWDVADWAEGPDADRESWIAATASQLPEDAAALFVSGMREGASSRAA